MFCRQNHFGLVADGRRVSDVSLGRFSLVSSDGVISDVQNRSLCLDSLCTPTVWLLMPIRSLIALSFILASGKFSEENATHYNDSNGSREAFESKGSVCALTSPIPEGKYDLSICSNDAGIT